MKGLVLKITLAVVGLFVVAGACSAAAYAFFNLDLPKIEKLQDYKPNLASQIYSKDGVLLAELGLEKREIVAIEDVPQKVINAFLAAEDDKFFEHKGVDYIGLSRAMFANFKAGRVVQGGSTITQQVAKSLLLTSERSFTRKLKDFILAQRIEEKLTKKEILYLYLNQVYLGGGYYGVKAAARGYFNKELSEITTAEAAMMAGLLVAPGKYSPYVKPSAAKMRQHYVLTRLLDLKKITKAEYDVAIKEKTVYFVRQDELKAGYFTEWVRQQVVEEVGEKEFLTNGYRIKTTLDYSLQKIAENEIISGTKEVDKRQGYKGPLGHLKPEELDDHVKNKRMKFYSDRSSFFTVNDNHQKDYEFKYDDKNFTELTQERELYQAELGKSSFVISLNNKDDVIKLLQKNKDYEAVVIGVDDPSRIIYVNLMGAVGLIPYDNFKWASKRSISENGIYRAPVNYPKEVVKVGDIVLVSVQDTETSIANHIYKDNKTQALADKNYAKVKNAKYVLCELEQVAEVQGAVFSMNSHTGEILSYVGGTDYSHSKFNRVIQAKRQPGSAFKPFIYAAALEQGYDPTTIIMDTPEALAGFDSASSWKPKNYTGKYKGPMTFRNALEQSQNIPAIKVADRVGVNNLIKFANRFGMNAKLQNDLSISLGTFVISPRDLTMSYAVLSNGGKYIMPKGIIEVVDRNGTKIAIDEIDNTVKIPEQVALAQKQKNSQVVSDVMESVNQEGNPFTRSLEGDQVYDPRLTYIIDSILKGVVQSGTGAGASGVSRNIGGKTGTTNDFNDAWFVGFNPAIATAVWVGFDDNRTMGYGETGGRAPVRVWRNFMKEAIAKYGDPEFQIPAGITQEWVNKETGQKAAPNSSGAILESFTDVPKTTIQTDESGNTTVTQPMGDDEYFENQ